VGTRDREDLTPRALLAAAILIAGCATRSDLTGTAWRLVEFRSADDRIGVVRPQSPDQYTMTLSADGRVAMRLNCNRASGTWTTAGAESAIAFSPLAMTRAACPEPSLDTQIARDSGRVRSYLLRDGRLHFNLAAPDGGTYVWERSAP
jgi:heat shock protein HslJ